MESPPRVFDFLRLITLVVMLVIVCLRRKQRAPKDGKDVNWIATWLGTLAVLGYSTYMTLVAHQDCRLIFPMDMLVDYVFVGAPIGYLSRACYNLWSTRKLTNVQLLGCRESTHCVTLTGTSYDATWWNLGVYNIILAWVFVMVPVILILSYVVGSWEFGVSHCLSC